jgi:hypothetical protein
VLGASVPVPSADLHVWGLVLAVAAAGTSVAAADDGRLLAGFQNVKASVFITSFSFAMCVAARTTRAVPSPRGHAIASGFRTGWYVRQDG